MKLLYLLKREPDKSLYDIIKFHKRAHEVSIVDIRDDKDYEKIIEQIVSADKVITW
jgi:hypothetical protein